jgi:signal recognition particle subunit SRP54
MFQNLAHKFGKLVPQDAAKKNLTVKDLDEFLKKIRDVFIEADVSIEVLQSFLQKIKKEATLKATTTGLTFEDFFSKLLYEQLVILLGEGKALTFDPPASRRFCVIMMVGLQGMGKTTSAAKIAHLAHSKGYKVLLASADIYRPAAYDQLKLLAEQISVDCLEHQLDESPTSIAYRALEQAEQNKYDVLIMDTAGRMRLDEILMEEAVNIQNILQPNQELFVADVLGGQEVIRTAQAFHKKLNLTGIVFTRTEAESKGGVILSIRSMTNLPVVFVGTGEKSEDYELFHGDRMAKRILDQGDFNTLLEQAASKISEDDMNLSVLERMKEEITFESWAYMVSVIKNLDKKMGGLMNMMKFLPGIGQWNDIMGKLPELIRDMKKDEVIIASMTHDERREKIPLTPSRKRRIAQGSGVSVKDVDAFVARFHHMKPMFKKMLAMNMHMDDSDQEFPKNFPLPGGKLPSMEDMYALLQKSGHSMPVMPSSEKGSQNQSPLSSGLLESMKKFLKF